MKGFYFSNEVFNGVPDEFFDEDIDFNWAGNPPKEGVNHENFSVRWEGYVKAPVDGKYKVVAVIDDGGEIQINERTVLSHNMYRLRDPDSTWLDVMHFDEDAKSVVAEVEDVVLTGGMKYKL